MEITYDVVIVGGGIAGFEAALALKNFRRDFLWIGSKPFGDKLPLCESAQNFPSFSGNGKELIKLLTAQMNREEIVFTEGRIDGIYSTGEGFLLTQNQTTYSSSAVILATGVETSANLKGEADFIGRGVSYCAVCDGALYKGKQISAILSSKEFEEEAEYLAGFAERVDCFCMYKNPALSAKNIVLHDSVPCEIQGNLRVESLVMKDGSNLSVDAVFLLKSSAPPAALVGGLETENGHVKVGRDMSTNLKGLFAAGDVTGRPYQFMKAAGEGLIAAYSVNDYLKIKS